MESNGWSGGHLLLHVHKGYGLSDASQLASIGAGATGIWCGVSANGAMTGHGEKEGRRRGKMGKMGRGKGRGEKEEGGETEKRE